MKQEKKCRNCGRLQSNGDFCNNSCWSMFEGIPPQEHKQELSKCCGAEIIKWKNVGYNGIKCSKCEEIIYPQEQEVKEVAEEETTCRNCKGYKNPIIEQWRGELIKYGAEIGEVDLLFLIPFIENLIIQERKKERELIREKMGKLEYVSRGETWASGYNQALLDIISILNEEV